MDLAPKPTGWRATGWIEDDEIKHLQKIMKVSGKQKKRGMHTHDSESESDWEDDLNYYKEQRGQHIRETGGEDRKYVRRERKRLCQPTAQSTPKVKMGQSSKELESDVSGSSSEEDNLSQDEYLPPQSSSKTRPKTITLNLPAKQILQKSSLSALRHNISPTVHTSVVADIIKLGGGKLSDTSISRSTARRQRSKAVERKHAEIKNDFQSNMPTYVEMHCDGKVITYQNKTKDDRICIKASFPGDMRNDLFLAAPFVVSGTGPLMKDRILETVAQ